MSFTLILRQCMRVLSPAFIEPRLSVCRAELLPARGEPDGGNHRLARGDDAQGWFVDTGESYYAASRERTIVSALYQGFVR